MIKQYIKEVEYEDLNDIQQKVITDKLDKNNYQGKQGVIDYVFEEHMPDDGDTFSDILMNKQIIIAADDGYIVLQYEGHDDDLNYNINTTPYFHPIKITPEDYVITLNNERLFDGVFGDTV